MASIRSYRTASGPAPVRKFATRDGRRATALAGVLGIHVRVARPEEREPRFLTWDEAEEVRSWMPEHVCRVVPIAILLWGSWSQQDEGHARRAPTATVVRSLAPLLIVLGVLAVAIVPWSSTGIDVISIRSFDAASSTRSIALSGRNRSAM